MSNVKTTQFMSFCMLQRVFSRSWLLLRLELVKNGLSLSIPSRCPQLRAPNLIPLDEDRSRALGQSLDPPLRDLLPGSRHAAPVAAIPNFVGVFFANRRKSYFRKLLYQYPAENRKIRSPKSNFSFAY